jgi:hypothetical protein
MRQTAIRGGVALALVCVERALRRFSVRDERVSELVETLWGFVEQEDLAAVDHAWRDARAVDLLDAIDADSEIPVTYRGLSPFLPRLLSQALAIAMVEMYGSVRGFGKESFDLTLRALEDCERNGVPLPAIAKFAQLPFSEEDGWGRAVPRSFFADPTH